MARVTRAQWADRVERWQKSGLSAGAFAKRHQLSESQLRWWRWRLRELADQVAIIPAEPTTPAPPISFVEVAPALAAESLEVVLVNGRRVRVPAGFDDKTLLRLLEILERRR